MVRILKVWDFVEKNIFGKASLIFVFSGLFVSILEVFSRYLFRSSKPWANELAVLFFITAILFHYGLALKDGFHIRVSIILERTSKIPRGILNIIADVLGIIFCAILIKDGYRLIYEVKRLEYATEILRIPTFLPYSVLTLGFLLLLINYFIDLYKQIVTLSYPNKSFN